MTSGLNKIIVVVSFLLVLVGGSVKAEGKEITLGNKTTSEVKEESLEIENWMVDLNVWLGNNVERSFVLDTDQELEVADWMINADSWKNNQTINLQHEKDEALDVEPWMINFSI